MIIAYYGPPNICCVCYDCAKFVPGCIYGTDCVWMVPGTFGDEGDSLTWEH
jgi:hypothetical protein